MEVEDLGRPPRQKENGKHTAPFPAELEPIKQKYAMISPDEILNHIDVEDLKLLFERYAVNIEETLYTLADAFGLNTAQLYNLMRRKEVKALYAPYKERRTKLYSEQMLKNALRPIKKIESGEDISITEIKAADLAAKYCAFMAKSTDPELGANTPDDGQIQVQVNALVKVKDFSINAALAEKEKEERNIIEVQAEDITEDGYTN